MTKSEELKAAFNTLQTLAEMIRAVGSIQSGVLYAQVCGIMNLQTYEKVIGLLVDSKVIRKDAHLLTWNVNE